MEKKRAPKRLAIRRGSTSHQPKSNPTSQQPKSNPSRPLASDIPHVEPWNPTDFNLNIEAGNTFLFRDHEAFTTFEGYKHRKICDPYFYKKLGSLPVWEKTKIEAYIDHWGMRALVECDEPYHATIVKAFYANLVPLEDQYGYQSYIGGQTILVTLESISEIFNLPNDQELEEMYLTHGNWPKPPEETWNQYRNWFNKDSFEDFYSTHLPALHRLAFLFINNILIPKSDIKTNIQFNNLFFLRHMIGLTERRFNIPYVIITHMRACLKYNLASLPYAHLIHRLLKHHEVDTQALSMLTHPNDPFTHPENLWREMPKHAGWVQEGNRLVPGHQPKNEWIRHPQATPNQYTDPNLPPSDTQSVPTSSSVPIPTSFNDFARATWERFDKIEIQNKTIMDNQTKLHDTVMKLAENQQTFNEHMQWVRNQQKDLLSVNLDTNARTKQIYTDAHSVAVGWVGRFGQDAPIGGRGEPSGSRGEGMDIDPTA